MELNRKLSHILSDQIPEYISDYYPLYVIFMTKYFEYLDNSSSGVQHSIQNIELNRDIDTTANNLAIQFLNTYVPNLPSTSEVDDTILVKYFKECFKNKGNEKSFRFFFKAFFNDDITIKYPREDMFKTSAGLWYVEKRLRVRANVGNPDYLMHTWVTGLTSTASAVVNDVVKVVGQNGSTVYDLVFEPSIAPRGTFTSGESIRGIFYDHVAETTSTVTVSSMSVLTTAQGVYKDSQSQLSHKQVLQDSLYYQQFSYVVRSQNDRKIWADHILKQLHPTGTVMFNEFTANTNPVNVLNTFGTSVSIDTTVAFPTTTEFILVPSFTFDRTADLQTGTSTTQLATTTGFATVTYTSIGNITYATTFDYPGEHVTFALQSLQDTYAGSNLREVTRFEGPSWDKFGSSIDLDEQLIAWPYDTNSGLTTTRYLVTSSITATNTVLLNMTSGTLRYKIPEANINSTSVGSMIMLITFAKNSRGNASGEENNVINIRLSSNATFVPYFDAEAQRNYKDIAVKNSLAFDDLIYFHSSNSIQFTIQTPGSVVASTSTGLLTGTATTFNTSFKEGDKICLDNFDTSYTITNIYSNTSMLITPRPVSNYASSIVYKAQISGTPVSSAAYVAGNEAMLRFKPYNGQRGASYDRLALRIELDQEQQYTTSTAESFNTTNITSTGLVASWSSTTTSVSATSFTSNTSTAFVFDTGAFIFNGGGSILNPFVATTSFTECGQLDLSVDYLVGNSSNGGNTPGTGQNLALQFSTNGGISWFTASDIWQGGSSNTWTRASTSLTGQIFTSVSSTTVYGIGANFTTNLNLGDRLYFLNNYNTTAYTVTAITNNNQISVSPATTQALRSSTAIVGRVWGPENTFGTSVSRLLGIGTNFTALSRDNLISIGTTTGTAYTIVNVVSDTEIDITPQLTLSYIAFVSTLTGTMNITSTTTSVVGSGTAFTTELSTGNVIKFNGANPDNTSYTVVNINSDTSITLNKAVIYTSSALTAYRVTSTGVNVSSYLQTAGVPFFKVLRAADQFQTTSLTVYGPGPETSVSVRIIRSTTVSSTENTYAINNLRATAFRYQDTTGVVNLHVSVSSGADLYVSDDDYLDITTIGTI
jgi:hypothetical protein